MRPRNIFAFVVLTGFLALPAVRPAQASPLTSFHGVFWYSKAPGSAISTAANYPTQTNVNAITDVSEGSFDVSALNFNTENLGRNFTYQDFLTSNGAAVTNASGTTSTFVSGYEHKKGNHSPGGAYGTIFQFTGEGYFNPTNNISVTSDDGFSFYVYSSTGSVLYSYTSNASPQSATTVTFSTAGLTAGDYSFKLNYGAVNGVPAVLDVNGLQAPVPEPSTVVLLGGCLIVFAIVRRKKVQKG